MAQSWLCIRYCSLWAGFCFCCSWRRVASLLWVGLLSLMCFLARTKHLALQVLLSSKSTGADSDFCSTENWGNPSVDKPTGCCSCGETGIFTAMSETAMSCSLFGQWHVVNLMQPILWTIQRKTKDRWDHFHHYSSFSVPQREDFWRLAGASG